MKKLLAINNKCRGAFLLGVGATIGTIVVIFLLVSVGYEGVLIPSPWPLFQQSTQIKSQAYYPFNFGQSSADDDITQTITSEYNRQMAGIPQSDRPSIDQWYSGNGQSADSDLNLGGSSGSGFAPCYDKDGKIMRCPWDRTGGGGDGGGGCQAAGAGTDCDGTCPDGTKFNKCVFYFRNPCGWP